MYKRKNIVYGKTARKAAWILVGVLTVSGFLSGCQTGENTEITENSEQEKTAEAQQAKKPVAMRGTGSTEGVDKNLELTQSQVNTEQKFTPLKVPKHFPVLCFPVRN